MVWNRKYLIWSFLCWICLTLSGYEPKVEAFPFVSVIMDSPAGFREWKDLSGDIEFLGGTHRKRLTIRAPGNTVSWRETRFSFTPDADGRFLLELGGHTWKGCRFAMCIDNIRINGKLLPNGDFENGAEGWKGKNPWEGIRESQIVKDPGVVRFGKQCVYFGWNPSIRIPLEGKKNVPVEISLQSIGCGPVTPKKDVFALDLAPFANMGFRDEVAGDGKGGWSDQGIQDLRQYDPRWQSFCGMDFRIPDPRKNNGKAVLTFHHELYCKTGLRKVKVDISREQPAGRFFYLLNTGCWMPGNTVVGTVRFRYADGSTERVELREGVHLADWGDVKSLSQGSVAYSSKRGNREWGFFMTRLPLRPGRPLREVEFETSGKAVWIVLGASISNREIPVGGERRLDAFVIGPEWKTADFPDLMIVPGSALDRSSLRSAAPAGAFGRVRAAADGTLEFEKLPGRRARFFGDTAGTFAVLPVQNYWNIRDNRTVAGFPCSSDLEFYRRYTDNLRRFGFNVVRMYPVCISTEKKNGGGDFDPEGLDLFDRAFAEYRKNGIYMMISFDCGSLGTRDRRRFTQDFSYNWKCLLFLNDPAVTRFWENTVRNFMNHVNPYTGIAYKDDPAILSVEYVNEQVLGFGLTRVSPETRARFNRAWQTHLKTKFSTLENFSRRTGVPAAAWEEITADLYEKPDAFRGEYYQFQLKLVEEFARRCYSVVRASGYRGLITQFNNGKQMKMGIGRTVSNSLTTINQYFAHPDNLSGKGVTRMETGSDIGQAAKSLRGGLGMRLANRPVIVTELNHAYPNPFLHEHGLLWGAYAGLQNYSGLIGHTWAAAPSRIRYGRIETPWTFDIGWNPIMRASHFMLASLFLRGDVRPAERILEVRMPREYLDRHPLELENMVSEEFCKLGLVSTFVTSFPGRRVLDPPRVEKKADWTFSSIPGSPVRQEAMFAEIVRGKGKSKLASVIADLKKRGILPAGNRTDPDAGIYESDTGELLMNTQSCRLSVQTACSEGVSLLAGESAELKTLHVRSTSRNACVFLTSVDRAPLAESRRMVLVYSTAALNSGLRMSADQSTIFDKGANPVLLQTGKLLAELNLPPGNWTCYALSVNGIRRERLPLSPSDGKWTFSLDTSVLKNGPTPFFEFIATP